MKEASTTWTMGGMKPFGMCITAPADGAEVGRQSALMLKHWAGPRHLVVLRGFAPLAGRELLDFCQQIGEAVEGEFGPDGEDAEPASAVPLHFDGLLGGPVPRYLFYVCQVAPPEGTGGESVFCNAARLVRQATAEQRALWGGVRLTCRVESPPRASTTPLVAPHPETREPALRFAEPGGTLRVELEGLPADAHAPLLAELARLAAAPTVCYQHSWKAGDMILADNHSLLHGRRACSAPTARHVKRVNIL